MAKPLAYIAGVLAIAGIFLTIFLYKFGFWNCDVEKFTLGNTTYASYWFSAVFGIGKVEDGVVSANPLYGIGFFQDLAGILMLVGGILCLTHSKTLAIIGGVCILAGVLLWVLIFPEIAKTFIENLMGNPDLITFSSLFSGSQNYVNFLTEYTVTFRAGYGLYVESIAGILGIVGAFVGSDR